MSSNTTSAAGAAAAAASTHRPRHVSSIPCILLNSNICIEASSRWNATTAVAETSNKLTVEVTLFGRHPPCLSNLAIYCPDANFTEQPKIIFTAEDLILLRVAATSSRTATLGNCDYFIYRAGSYPKPPLLTLIPDPRPNCFRDTDVGVLPRGGDLYTIAALLVTGRDEYELCLFDSEVGSWVIKAVSLEAPRRPFPSSFKTRRDHHHTTSSVITVGGEAGTMGWVDLWGGILFHDLLRGHDRPVLRHVPLPLPADILALEDWKGVKLNCPDSRRGAFSLIKDSKACLKLVDLQITCQRLPYNDIETRWPAFEVDNWTITVWSNSVVSDSDEGWHEDFTVRASDIIISNEVRSQLLKSGLLHRKPSWDGEAPAVEVALQNLVVSDPNVSLNVEEDVIYVVASTKFRDHKGWVLGIDMRKSTLLGVAQFGAEYMPGCFSYRPGTISKYMGPSATPVRT